MRLNVFPSRGLAVAFCALAGSAIASADCPEVGSLERYVETTRDALIALEGSIPASQYLDLSNRYAAMIVLEWDQAGLEAIEDDSDALSRIMACFRDKSCGTDGDDPIDAQLSDLVADRELELPGFYETLTEAPSDAMLLWAEIELECREPLEPEAEPETDDEETLSETSEDDAPAESAALMPDAQDEDAETSVTFADTVSGDIAASDQASEQVSLAEAPTLTDEEARDLVETAAISIAAGDIEEAIPLLRESCFYDVTISQTSVACDTLLDVYEVQTLQGQEDIASSNFLAFSEEVCGAGYIQGCLNTALYLRAANTTGAYERSVLFTARACELGDPIACATLANEHLEGRTQNQDLALARTSMQRACDLGQLSSCREVADLYVRGVGGEADNNLALRAVAMACPEVSAQNPDLCVSAADFVLINMRSGVDRAMRVRTFIKRACDIGHDIGCAWYAEDLELGIGGRADPQGARQARLVACEYGDQDSCNPRS